MADAESPQKSDVFVRPEKRMSKTESGFLVVTGLKHEDTYTTLDEVTAAIRAEGVEKCGLIFGIDYTMSNIMQGRRTFGGKNLHDISQNGSNPYQEVICVLGETIGPLDDDGIIPTYGFGDKTVADTGIFPIEKDGRCEGFNGVYTAYTRATPEIELGGPTNFAPIIEKAIEIVKERQMFHILVIVADGQVTRETNTIDAIVAASDHALSIIVIGVGDGPWYVMEDFSRRLPARRFNNFQFVDFHDIKSKARSPQTAIALKALCKVPEQYRAIKTHGLLRGGHCTLTDVKEPS